MKIKFGKVLFFLALFAGTSICFADDYLESPFLLKFEASRAVNTVGQPNSRGVYPVRLRWQNPSITFSNYCIYRSNTSDSGFVLISTVPAANKGIGDFFTFIDENSSAIPARPYYYKIVPMDLNGRDLQSSEIIMGWGALTYEAYIMEYIKTLKSSNQKLTLMNKKSAMQKLGLEQKNGDISGSLSYNARLAGLSGKVIMIWDHYADFFINNDRSLGPVFILNGTTNTTTSMTQNGTIQGTITVSGMYPGLVSYDNIQIKNGIVGGGVYGVEPDGFSRGEVSWTVGEK